MPRLLLGLFLLLNLAGCNSPGARIAAEARQALVGMRADDLQACAGIPTRTRHLSDGTDLFSYEQRNANVGGLHLNVPTLGEFAVGSSGSYCHALFRIAEDRVVGLNYTGDNDDVFGREGVCAPIVRGCLRYPEPARIPPPVVGRFDPAAAAGQASP
ncbi:hypothetical protein QMO56_25425 [Roseomonas sp. E05]|uniref:hypothetical protein n=1 Tax=Roseomonas sp. E05 TaxID=3046310 RepID=UPI0024BB543C|nr:hypothetical protein [Roseomonas sp. E05]MDJ0391450.1 hypothetical protein [Roseomonas sp. E05]